MDLDWSIVLALPTTGRAAPNAGPDSGSPCDQLDVDPVPAISKHTLGVEALNPKVSRKGARWIPVLPRRVDVSIELMKTQLQNHLSYLAALFAACATIMVFMAPQFAVARIPDLASEEQHQTIGQPRGNAKQGSRPKDDLRTILSEAIQSSVAVPREHADTPNPSREIETMAALSDASVGALRGVSASASSSLDPERAVRLARLICACTPGASYCYILPTGSMQPLFGEKVILLLEAVPFTELHIGDIITYHHPRSSALVVHRLIGQEYEQFRSKGDANRYEDDTRVTSSNYRQRVFGIIYLNSSPQ